MLSMFFTRRQIKIYAYLALAKNIRSSDQLLFIKEDNYGRRSIQRAIQTGTRTSLV